MAAVKRAPATWKQRRARLRPTASAILPETNEPTVEAAKARETTMPALTASKPRALVRYMERKVATKSPKRLIIVDRNMVQREGPRPR